MSFINWLLFLITCSALFLTVFDFKFLPRFSGVLLVSFMEKNIGVFFVIFVTKDHFQFGYIVMTILLSAFFWYGLIDIVLLDIIYMNTSFFYFSYYLCLVYVGWFDLCFVFSRAYIFLIEKLKFPCLSAYY